MDKQERLWRSLRRLRCKWQRDRRLEKQLVVLELQASSVIAIMVNSVGSQQDSHAISLLFEIEQRLHKLKHCFFVKDRKSVV